MNLKEEEKRRIEFWIELKYEKKTFNIILKQAKKNRGKEKKKKKREQKHLEKFWKKDHKMWLENVEEEKTKKKRKRKKNKEWKEEEREGEKENKTKIENQSFF